MIHLNETFTAVQSAGRELAIISDERINEILNAVADAAIAEAAYILSENKKVPGQSEVRSAEVNGRPFEEYCR